MYTSTALRVLFATVLSCGCLAGVGQDASPTKPAAWPDPLRLESGEAVNSGEEFNAKRRPELLSLFSENVYGRSPTKKLPERIKIDSTETVFGGLAVRKQITIFLGAHEELKTHLLLYLPAVPHKPAGVFVGLNFDGNQTVDADSGITLNPVWLRDPALVEVPIAKERSGHVRQLAAESTRGSAAKQWQLRLILEHGYGLATVYAGDFEPDFSAGIGYGVRPLFFAPDQRLPHADDWGAIGAWAWGMSRAVDYLEQDPEVDSTRIIAFGHSRLGKAALWSAAQDLRFAAVISNNSGQGGATLSHREAGESIDHMILAFPYWFSPNYNKYLGNVNQLPLDGHLLLALIAPRPLYVASGADDPFSDPEGEFLAAAAATPVYRLFGKEGVEEHTMPPINHPVGGTLRYHVRTGGHDVTAFDWQHYLTFADELPHGK